ncbi:probable cytochrome P450 28d2 [Cotesia glomerata]|uniref:probable cytochrome P450 28d2 n=1 Tax=Cotesia glomerata TaxID=32391 RepID=UPI001D018FF8|nr:probable cytochrome P450 28d2 [Cotesia glomerata]
MIWVITYIGVVLFLVLMYKYLTRNYNHWNIRKIPTARGAVLGFGHMLDVMMLKKNLSTLLQETYNAYPDVSMVGLFDFDQPALLIKDPELVKTVIQIEFASFSDHMTLNIFADPLLTMDPAFVNGEKWKHIRGMFSKAFSVKNLKFISLVAKYECDKLVEFIDKKFDKESVVDVNAKHLFSNFTAQVVAHMIFGVDGEAFDDFHLPESFRTMMDAMFEANVITGIRQNIFFSLPLVGKLLNVGFVPSWVNVTFTRVVNEIRELRKSLNLKKYDILQQIIDYEADNKYGDVVACYAFLFFIEGYETSSLTLSSTAYLLSKYPKFQTKARKEVDRVMDKYKSICYDAINEMTYLDQIIQEAIRLFSPVASMQKICTKSITLQGVDGLACALDPGDVVFISSVGIHRDEKYWQNPNDFNPDRFAKGSEGYRKHMYLGFGEGPRKCPGKRMAIVQVKAAMAIILKNYIIEASSRTVEPVKIEPKYFLTTAQGGFWIELRRLTCSC